MTRSIIKYKYQDMTIVKRESIDRLQFTTSVRKRKTSLETV